MTLKVALLQPLTPDLSARTLALVPEGFTLEIATSTDIPVLEALVADADYAVAFGMAVPAEVLRAGAKLRMLHRWGVGLDGVPVDTARELGIAVAKTTGSNARPVAEYTVGAMLASARVLTVAHRSMQEGKWMKKELWPHIFMLAGKTIGLVGFGTIAQLVARRLVGFECTVLYNKRERLPAEQERELNVSYASLDEILTHADIVSLHTPLTAATKHMIARPQLQQMKRSAVLINTARGGVVHEGDLAWALTNGIIRSAVLDVFEREPTPADNPLLHLDNVIATPHIAANAYDNIDNGVRHWFGNLVRHSRGEALPPADLVVEGDPARFAPTGALV